MNVGKSEAALLEDNELNIHWPPSGHLQMKTSKPRRIICLVKK